MPTTITLDAENIKIPLEMLGEAEGEGFAVLTLAPGAYLIMRSNLLAIYPRQRLAELTRTARALQSVLSEEPFHISGALAPSSGKRMALRQLWQQGYLVSDGSDYGLQQLVRPGVSLDQVWQELDSMSGSLAQEILDERDE